MTLEDPKFAQNPPQEQSRTALGSLAPLKEPLRMQNTHFRFNVQLLGDKMGSHFEFQLFKVKNKLLGSIFVHFFSPRAVATALGSLAPLKEPLRMQNTHFQFNI